MPNAPGSARILVVEDEPDIRALLETVLSSAGYVVAAAANGRAGLARMNEFQPDVVLLDLEMPEIDGLGFLSRKREIPEFNDTPVIVLSARSRTMDVIRAMDMGAHNFIAKPFEIRLVIENVARLARPRSAGAVS